MPEDRVHSGWAPAGVTSLSRWNHSTGRRCLEVWIIFVCFGWGNRIEAPQQQNVQQKDKTCPFVRCCLGLNHCAVTEPIKKEAAIRWAAKQTKVMLYQQRQIYYLHALFSQQQCLKRKKVYVAKCMISYLWGSADHISHPISYWTESAHQIMTIKLKCTDASLDSQLVAPLLSQLQHWDELSFQYNASYTLQLTNVNVSPTIIPTWLKSHQYRLIYAVYVLQVIMNNEV